MDGSAIVEKGKSPVRVTVCELKSARVSLDQNMKDWIEVGRGLCRCEVKEKKETRFREGSKKGTSLFFCGSWQPPAVAKASYAITYSTTWEFQAKKKKRHFTGILIVHDFIHQKSILNFPL